MTSDPVYVDDVVPMSRDEYKRDRDQVARWCLDLGATRVFEIGSCRAPGISDVDLVAMFKDDVDWQRLHKKGPPLPLPLPRTFLHMPWAMAKRHLQVMGDLFAIRTMRDVVTGVEETIAQDPWQRVAWNIEACCSTRAALLTRQGHTSARSMLCLLNGITYNVELARAEGVASPDGETFHKDIANLRAAWMCLDPDQRQVRLSALRTLGEGVLQDLLEGYGSLLTRSWQLRGGTIDALRVPGTRMVYRFDRPRGGGREGQTLRLPPSIGPFFALLATPGLGLERWLRPSAASHLERAVSAPPECLAAITRYCQHNAELVQMLGRCRIPFMVLNGGTLCFANRSLWREVPLALSRRLQRFVIGRRRALVVQR